MGFMIDNNINDKFPNKVSMCRNLLWMNNCHLIFHCLQIEESILESLAFKSDSPMWDAIEQHEGKIPSVEEVIFSLY